jgi:transcriptional regulator with XRE-family HTH domain
MIRRMEKLRAWLTASDITQLEFAREMGVSQPTVSDWLTGRTSPTAAKLKAIAARTGLSIDELLSAAQPQPSPSTHAAA